MKVLKFKTEEETAAKVVELTRKGIKFNVTGRKEIIVL